jgi:hypothetical protein
MRAWMSASSAGLAFRVDVTKDAVSFKLLPGIPGELVVRVICHEVGAPSAGQGQHQHPAWHPAELALALPFAGARFPTAITDGGGWGSRFT